MTMATKRTSSKEIKDMQTTAQVSAEVDPMKEVGEAAKIAAERWITDDNFSHAFDVHLAEWYDRQREELDKVGRKLGRAAAPKASAPATASAPKAPRAPKASSGGGSDMEDKIVEFVSAQEDGVKAGQIAAHLKMDKLPAGVMKRLIEEKKIGTNGGALNGLKYLPL